MKLTELVKEIKRQIDCRELFHELFPDLWRSSGNFACAWHEDQEPSLQPFQDHLYCHSEKHSYDCFDIWRKAHGCTFAQARDALAARLGLTVEAHTPKANQEPVAVYQYTDETGGLLFEVCRYEPKRFVQRRPDPVKPGGWIYKTADVRKTLYRLPELLQAPTDAWVFLNEGEKATDALAALGLVSTCAPSGAGKFAKWVKEREIHAPLQGRRVVILADNDEPGKKDAEEKAKLLHGHAAEIRVIRFPDLPEHADAFDLLEHYGDAARDKLLALVEQAPVYKPPRTGPEIISVKELIETEIEPPRWVIRDLICEGVSLLVAKPKHGKSWLSLALSLAVSQGREALGYFKTVQCGALNLCLEDTRRRLRERLGMILDGGVPPDNCFVTTTWPSFADGGIDHLHKYLDEHPNVKLVSIDTYGAFRGKKGRTDDIYQTDYSDVQQLQGLARLFGCAVVLIHHLRKESSDDVVDNILGSTALSGAADGLLVLMRKSRNEFDAVLHVSGRDLADEEHALTFERGLWLRKGDPVGLALTDERRAVREAIVAAGKPLGIGDVKAAVGKSYEAVRKTMNRMVEKGELERCAGRSNMYTLPPEDALYGSVSGPWRDDRPSVEYPQGVILDHL